MLERILQFVGLAPSEREKQLLYVLGTDAPQSMRVIGRGTLTMDPAEARRLIQKQTAR